MNDVTKQMVEGVTLPYVWRGELEALPCLVRLEGWRPRNSYLRRGTALRVDWDAMTARVCTASVVLSVDPYRRTATLPLGNQFCVGDLVRGERGVRTWLVTNVVADMNRGETLLLDDPATDAGSDGDLVQLDTTKDDGGDEEEQGAPAVDAPGSALAGGEGEAAAPAGAGGVADGVAEDSSDGGDAGGVGAEAAGDGASSEPDVEVGSAVAGSPDAVSEPDVEGDAAEADGPDVESPTEEAAAPSFDISSGDVLVLADGLLPNAVLASDTLIGGAGNEDMVQVADQATIMYDGHSWRPPSAWLCGIRLLETPQVRYLRG